MKIKTLIPFATVTSGVIFAPKAGSILEVSDEFGAAFIAEGFAEAYNLVEPTGNKEITDTAETDVAAYATAQVVDANLIAGNIKKDVTILGVTGTLE